ncbi:MAG: hypothetical protein QOK44_1203, partial [Betaproteobacteria bacterium]|nr:hypothetical protein [Betaproteobacteria bacterium]
QLDAELSGAVSEKAPISDDHYARRKLLAGEHDAQIGANTRRLACRDSHERCAEFPGASIE